VRVYLFGYLEDDFLGRVMVVPEEMPVGVLAAQLSAWSAEDGGATVDVIDEAGATLDLGASVAAAGLGNGHIFTVRRGG